jgi:hypothetical protein
MNQTSKVKIPTRKTDVLGTRVLLSTLRPGDPPNVVDSRWMRRSLILALGLSLVGLGPLPLSNCALFSAKLAECATPKTQPHCQRMNMEDTGSKLAAQPDMSCCYISNSTMPESQFEAPELVRNATPADGIETTWKVPGVENERPADVVQNQSPPSPQSLLCTFLI